MVPESFARIDGKGKNKFQKTGTKFQKAGKTTPVTCVVFVPITRRGLLVKKLREKEDQMRELTVFRIKFQESDGSQLVNSFEKDLGKG